MNGETPEGGWPAQPDLTPRIVFALQLRDDAITLEHVARYIDGDPLRKRAVRDELRKVLAGVIAHCETLRLALEKNRT